MSHDDSEGLAELVRRRWGIDIDREEPSDEAPPVDPSADGPRVSDEPPVVDEAAPADASADELLVVDEVAPMPDEVGAADEPRVADEPVAADEFASISAWLDVTTGLPHDAPRADDAIPDQIVDLPDGPAEHTESGPADAEWTVVEKLGVFEGSAAPGEGIVSAPGPQVQGHAEVTSDYEIVEDADPHLLREHAMDLRLARLHLRTGAVALARAELEALAVLRALDVDAHLDLAETRWRAGDLAGAGDAVVEYLERGGGEALAYVIAAEASAAMGRIGDARRLARRALDRLTVPLEQVFAGQPRSDVWPGPTDAEIQPVSTLFSAGGPDPMRGGRIGLSGVPGVFSGHVRPLEPLLASGQMDPWESQPGPGHRATAEAPAFEPLSLGLDLDRVEATRPSPPGFTSVGGVGPGLLDPADELELAKAELASGEPDRAAVRLALVLRASPGLAPAVLEVTEGVAGPAFGIVRGDALRAAGREAAARDAFAAAVRAMAEVDRPDMAGGASAITGGGRVPEAILLVDPEPVPADHLAWPVPDVPTDGSSVPGGPRPVARSEPELMATGEPSDRGISVPWETGRDGTAASGPPPDAGAGGWSSPRRFHRTETGNDPVRGATEEPLRRARPGPPPRRPPVSRPAHLRHHDPSDND